MKKEKQQPSEVQKQDRKPLRQKGGMYFYSGVIMGKKNVFVTAEYIDLLTNAFKLAELKMDVKNLAYVIMPNHFYWLFRLSANQDDPVAIYKEVKGKVAMEIMKNLQEEVKLEKPFALVDLFKKNERIGRSTPQKLLWSFEEYAKAFENNKRFKIWMPKTEIRLIDNDELLQKKLAVIKNAPVGERWKMVASPEEYPYLYLSDEVADTAVENLTVESLCPVMNMAAPMKVKA